MQAENHWTPPSGALGRLTAAAHERASALLPRLAELRARLLDRPPPPPFAEALAAGGLVAVIAEIKRRSPSKGVINDDIRGSERGGAYVAGGARALSVLTEPLEFGGSLADLVEIGSAVAVPLLKKDFHVHEAQVWEARAHGASAMLFIARALPPSLLDRLVEAAIEAGVEPLVEIRTEGELERALATPARMIGVNARDLETLAIDDALAERLLPAIPGDRLRIAESGMRGVADVERAAALGADAVLIGSALSVARDAQGATAALASVERRRRAT